MSTRRFPNYSAGCCQRDAGARLKASRTHVLLAMPPTLTVLFTIADLQPECGGPSFSVPALADAVARTGIAAELLAHEYGPNKPAPQVLPPPLKTTLIPCRGVWAQKSKWSPAFGSALRAACAAASKRSSKVIIHDTGLWLRTNHAAARISREFQIPRMVSPRGMLSRWALDHKGWKKKLAWKFYQQHDLQTVQALHATSQAEADEFRALGLTQPIAVIPNGVAVPPPVSELRSPKSEVRTVLFLSRIHPKKGLLNLVRAWATLRTDPLCTPGASTENWKVLIAGGDDTGHLAEIKAEIKAQQLESCFEFVGEVEGRAKWDLYRGADLFVLPSHSENFGLVIAEALACGVPVITTRGTPWADLVTQRCGWWVDIGVEPLANALREAMNSSSEKRREMGGRGRELVAAKYGWPGLAGQMHSVYLWMLRQGSKPGCVSEYD